MQLTRMQSYPLQSCNRDSNHLEFHLPMAKTRVIGVEKQPPMTWKKQEVPFDNSIETGPPKECLNEKLAMVQYSELFWQSVHHALVQK
jgi:hypothetical protein